ncbi:hypothetical protein CWE09_09660 [Aliidiomarina minuta]|uniref:Amidohydrolase-related domain-containing protein n=1 Tax=Aliidiomarina minuta TaxID=880057 RepID=A0A432WAC9_9GAMM|nr:amidohydrolase family protein [Aliidiomarina minuta]RUO26936.1 hypothetical protein CWE09_09660 [Aliidiomarina minuta]
MRKYSVMLLCVSGLLACSPEPGQNPVESEDLAQMFAGTEVWAGATIWLGSEQGYQENAAMVVRNGKVMSIFSLEEQPLPEGVDYHDVSGQYIIPGLINAHGHVGMARGLQTGEAAHSEDNVRDQLELYAHYGVTSVVSLGDEPPEAFQVRDAQVPADPQRARLWLAGDVLNPETRQQAREQVEAAIPQQPDWLKIRVDDQLGRQEAMPREIYSQVIESADRYELPLASHMVTLEDSKGLLEEGTSLLAHSIRDAEVDQELIDLMLADNICLTPTLTREVSVYVYAERPDFFDDPFFLATADEEVLEELQKPEVQQNFRGKAADYYREALPLAKQNMMRLHEAGVRIAMGTDSGPPARFQGYFEHMEMEMMEDAGMSAEDVLVSATRHAAACMGLDDELGTLESGKWADFIVLNEDPLQRVRNLRSIEAVYLAGERFTSEYSYDQD